MRLPIPIFSGTEIFREIEVESPRAGVLAETQKAAEQGSLFAAILTLVTGCVVSIDNITDKSQIRALCRKMPYRDAEYVAVMAVIKISPDDGFEGVYTCPRCSNRIITEYKEIDGEVIDTRDYISDLPIGLMDDDTQTFSFDLSEAVEIKSEGNVLESISSFEMRYPTMSDCIIAESKYGNNNSLATQFGIYVQALIKVNGQEIDVKWKNRFGKLLFDNIRSLRLDLMAIGHEMERYGMVQSIERTCPSCGKVWKSQVNTSGFFESALRT